MMRWMSFRAMRTRPRRLRRPPPRPPTPCWRCDSKKKAKGFRQNWETSFRSHALLFAFRPPVLSVTWDLALHRRAAKATSTLNRPSSMISLKNERK
jgi:hypothetical protein